MHQTDEYNLHVINVCPIRRNGTNKTGMWPGDNNDLKYVLDPWLM